MDITASDNDGDSAADGIGGGLSAEDFVKKCEIQMSHAWMVRTFVKHSEEAEDAVELMALPRLIFDLSMALESRTSDPAAYHKMLSKKLGKLRKASEQFAADAPAVSTHTNFQMAAASAAAVVAELDRLRSAWSPALPPRSRVET